MARLMLTRLSAMTPRPTQRFMPASPLYRLRFSPCRRLTTLMGPRSRCAISARCGTSAFSARVCAPGSWGALGDAYAPDALGLGGGFFFGRVEAGIGGYQVRRASQPCLMGFDRRHQYV